MFSKENFQYLIRTELEKLQNSEITLDHFVQNIVKMKSEDTYHLDKQGIGQMKVKNMQIVDRNTILNLLIDEDEIKKKQFIELGGESLQVSLYELFEAQKEAQSDRTSHILKYCKYQEEVDVYYHIDIFTDHDDDEVIQVYIRDVSQAINLQKDVSDEFYQEAIEANFSHQQMTPINNIINNARLITNKISAIANQDLSSNEKFKKLQSFANWCLDITNQQLQCSQILYYYNRCQLLKMKIRQGKNSIEPKAIQRPEDEINKVLEPFRYQIEDLGIQVKIERNGDPFPNYLTTDWEYYQLAMYNVLKNAVKHNVQGGALHVQIEVVEEQNNTMFLRTVVTDSGKGINPLTQKHIFKQFAQMQQRMKTGEQGIGTGLSSSKVIVEALDGEIKLLESRIGKTQFQIFVPIECHHERIKKRRFQRSCMLPSSSGSRLRKRSFESGQFSNQNSSNIPNNRNFPNSVQRFSEQSLSNINSWEFQRPQVQIKQSESENEELIKHLQNVIRNQQEIIDKLTEDDIDEHAEIPSTNYQKESACKFIGQQNLINKHTELVNQHEGVANYLKQKIEQFSSELSFAEYRRDPGLFRQSSSVSFEIADDTYQPIHEQLSFGQIQSQQQLQSSYGSILGQQNHQINSDVIPKTRLKVPEKPRIFQPIIRPQNFKNNGLLQILEESKSDLRKMSPLGMHSVIKPQRIKNVSIVEERKEPEISKSQNNLKHQSLASIKAEQKILEVIMNSDFIKCSCKPRILLVDDNKFNLLPLVTMMKTMTFDIDLIQRLKAIVDPSSKGLSSYVSQKEESIVDKMEICSLNEEEIKENLEPQKSQSIPLSSTQEIITPDEVYDGFQAIIKYQESMRRPKCCQNAWYKLIIMDYNMPEINGLEATKQILEIQQQEMTLNPDHEVRIVGLTANTGTKMRQECIEAGQKQIYEKPISHLKLKEMILLYHYRLTDSQYENYISREKK